MWYLSAMRKCDKLLEKARNAPHNLRFNELCALAKCWGYALSAHRGSHRKYKHTFLRLPALHAMHVFQNVQGKAKPYQIDQLLDAIAYIEEHFPDFRPE